MDKLNEEWETISFPDNMLLIELCGEFDKHLTQIESHIGVQILRRGNELSVSGPDDERAVALMILQEMYERLEAGREVTPAEIDAAIRMRTVPEPEDIRDGDQIEMFSKGPVEIRTRKKVIEPRTPTQKEYVHNLFQHELVFGLGPAGTGKTYLAVAVGVSMFLDGLVDKIILCRPAVEAGERLGFLPGTQEEKVDPYMQPLYDALNDFIPGKQVEKLKEDKKIEVAPLAFMRGRTLSNAFIVLDEAQNATTMQMKMFLTRMGEGSRMAITGDASQVDLPRGVESGLVEAARVLDGVDGVGFTKFTSSDVVRHPMVAKIIKAYEKHGA